MKRLTKPDSKYTDFKNRKLQQYENTGLTPEEIKSLYHDAGLGLAMRCRDLSAQLADTQAALEAAQAVVEAAKDYINADLYGFVKSDYCR